MLKRAGAQDLNWADNIVDTNDAASKFLESGFLARSRMLIRAQMQLGSLPRYSIFDSRGSRCARNFTKLLSAFVASAAFFQSSGEAFTAQSDPMCEASDDIITKLVRAAAVGTLSALLGDVIVERLASLARPNVVKKWSWSRRQIRWQMCMWRAKTLLFWLLWLMHTLFCGLFLSAFLANVTLATGGKLFEAAAVVLIEEHVLAPLIIAAFYAWCVTILLCCRPSLRAEVLTDAKRKKLNNLDDWDMSSDGFSQPDAEPDTDVVLELEDANHGMIVPGWVEQDLRLDDFDDELDEGWGPSTGAQKEPPAALKKGGPPQSRLSSKSTELLSSAAESLSQRRGSKASSILTSHMSTMEEESTNNGSVMEDLLLDSTVSPRRRTNRRKSSQINFMA